MTAPVLPTLRLTVADDKAAAGFKPGSTERGEN
ncbi:hypothetical protein BVIR_1321 [Blastochloris viridis]|uniref:Uncharacterized protein n=1 Tax=Blastochloris viridis TaxID=1079 RepID=A0A0P0IYZ8_BLAVI|nr:hypothetical protein BVIR_1321 [Blastochloris viridis]CUU41770.1 hypothetical protein BVIRIDIS_07660 [Blastochloris viridis]